MKTYNKRKIKAQTYIAKTPLTDGFTLLELMVIVAIIGILFAISAPGWSAFVANQRLNTAQDEVYQAVRAAQVNAKRQRVNWQFTAQDVSGRVNWAIHPASINPATVPRQSLNQTIRIDSDETTLHTTDGVHRIRFDYNGNIVGQLGGLTLRTGPSNTKLKRCIITSTLLGAIRKGQEHRTQRDGKYCY